GLCRWEDSMTVALVLAGNLGEDDAGQQQQMLCGQLAALGVRRVDAAERTGPGLLTVAAAARGAGDRVLICAGAQTVPGPVLARLLSAGGTAAVTRLTAGTARGSSPGSSPGSWPAQPSGALIVDLPDLDALARSAETLAATQAGPEPGTAVGALIDELGRSPTRPPATWPAGRPGAGSPRPRSTGSRSASGWSPRSGSPNWMSAPSCWPYRRWPARSCSPGLARWWPRPAAMDASVRSSAGSRPPAGC